MTTPTFTPPPTAPSRSDPPATFVSRANAFVAWIVTFVSELVTGVAWFSDNASTIAASEASAADAAATASLAALTAVGATDYAGTSGSSLSLTAGSKAVHLDQAGKHFAVNDDIVMIRRGNPNLRMYGAISAWDGVDDATVTVASDGIVGSGGPFTDWMVVLAVFATPGAKAVDVRAGVSKYMSMTPGDTYDAFAEVALTDASTIAVDMSTFVNAAVTLGGNRTLGNPTNPKPGQLGRIRLKQDGTGSRALAFASHWQRDGGTPILSTTAAVSDYIYYDVVSSTEINYSFVRSPTN